MTYIDFNWYLVLQLFGLVLRHRMHQPHLFHKSKCYQEMDGTSDDEDEERMPNGDLSRDLRQDDDDLRDPVNVSWVVLNYNISD